MKELEKEYEDLIVKQDAMFNSNNIPEEFRGWLASQAWEEGHSCGYNIVLTILEELVFTFKKPVEKYTDRIVEDSFQDGYGEAMTDVDMGPL